MIYDANFLAAFRKPEKTKEMDFSKYAGQLRPLTHRDAVAAMDVEAELERDLDRALAQQKVCDCYYCLEMKGKQT